jgi:hypothetical protein
LSLVPAVFIKGENITLVFNASNTAVIFVLGGENFVSHVVGLTALFSVLGAIVPQKTEHHLTFKNGNKILKLCSNVKFFRGLTIFWIFP